MSKRQEEKEKLARLLDAGKITAPVYDQRMARMAHTTSPKRAARKKVADMLSRGRINQATADKYLREIEATGAFQPVTEWRPGTKPS